MKTHLQRDSFLNLLHKPARVTLEETGWLLGFATHEVLVLAQAGMLKPLGHPTRNAVKTFAAVTVFQLATDERWLSKAVDALQNHWRARNRSCSKRARSASPPTVGVPDQPAEFSPPLRTSN